MIRPHGGIDLFRLTCTSPTIRGRRWNHHGNQRGGSSLTALMSTSTMKCGNGSADQLVSMRNLLSNQALVLAGRSWPFLLIKTSGSRPSSSFGTTRSIDRILILGRTATRTTTRIVASYDHTPSAQHRRPGHEANLYSNSCTLDSEKPYANRSICSIRCCMGVTGKVE